MAMIKCKECKKKISSLAATCPNCGAPVTEEVKEKAKKKKSSHGTGCLIFVIAVVGSIWFAVYIANIAEKKIDPDSSQQTQKTLSQTKQPREIPSDTGKASSKESKLKIVDKLPEEKRKEIFQWIVKAEDKAHKKASDQYPIDPTQSFRVGQKLQLSKATPLMPELNPADPMAALQKMRSLPTRSRISVIGIATKNNTPWYLVEATSASNSPLGKGWINSMALMGQAKADPKEQIKKQGECENDLLVKYRKEIAEKYGITLEQLKAIEVEAWRKNWPEIATSRYREEKAMDRAKVQKSKEATAKKKATKAKERDAFIKEMEKTTIPAWMAIGLLTRINPVGFEAFVDPVAWSDLDITTKEMVAHGLALYCTYKTGADAQVSVVITHIKDTRSGKKFAKYGPWGFKVY